jgi:hypothetical protein
MFSEREPERYALHSRYMNEMMVRVLQTIGYDVGFRSGTGQYLFDRDGVRYLDLLSGWGVFGIGPEPSGASRGSDGRPFGGPSQFGADGRFAVGRHPGGEASPVHTVSRKGLLYQFRCRSR